MAWLTHVTYHSVCFLASILFFLLFYFCTFYSMLAVVQPYSASPDVGHRARPSLSSTSSSRSSSSNLAPIQPPSLQRHQTLSSAHPPPRTPPLKPLTPTLTSLPTPDLQFDIHSYPATDLLKLLALLLTHIATTNDHLSPTNSSSGSSSNAPSSPLDPIDAPPLWHTLTTASRGAISTSAATLTFHARNIPTISLEAYLLRILKYCPTTNHVFLSLLVYFDRMSKLSEDSVGRAFVIDSYNIHRLVIAGVTVASKFFSDVFYTNSRYAKVCRIVTASHHSCSTITIFLSNYFSLLYFLSFPHRLAVCHYRNSTN